MSYGIRVSKPGKDVNTSGVNDLFLDTTYPSLKVAQSGTGSLSVSDGSSDSDTISHNLGYVPRVLIYGQYYSVFTSSSVSDYVRYPKEEYLLSGTIYSVFDYSVDSSNLVINGSFTESGSSSGTFNYFYYIFYDAE